MINVTRTSVSYSEGKAQRGAAETHFAVDSYAAYQIRRMSLALSCSSSFRNHAAHRQETDTLA